MLVRLLLALLLAAVAVPTAAPAACHDAPASGHAMPMPADDGRPDAVPVHACAGCIPPSDWLGARVAAPLPIASAPPSPMPPASLAGTGAPPDLPPPRRG
jgi:hypothetical protein